MIGIFKREEARMSKLEQLKAMVRGWKKEKSLTTAYDICEFLADNLNLEDGE